MLKIGVNFYFGKKKIGDFLKRPTEESKKLFMYEAVDGGGRLCLALARKTVEIAKEALLTGEYDPVPLDEKYRKWKVKRGYNPKIGFLSGTMFENISYFRTGDRKGWVAGFPTSPTGAVGKKLLDYKGKTPLTTYAWYFEMGNTNQIRRPFLRYSLDKMMKENFSKIVYDQFTTPFERIWWKESWRFKKR